MKEKLLWIELAERGRFAYDDGHTFGEATVFIMTGEYVKYLCALLNTNLICWFFKQVAPTSGLGALRWKKVYIEEVPIPRLSAEEQFPFVQLMDSILAETTSDPSADVDEQEAEIDRLVYELYGLTAEEVAAVQERA